MRKKIRLPLFSTVFVVISAPAAAPVPTCSVAPELIVVKPVYVMLPGKTTVPLLTATVPDPLQAHLADEFDQTLSAGVAAYPESGEHPLDLIAAADTALYKAKGEGRNRVCADPGTATPAAG